MLTTVAARVKREALMASRFGIVGAVATFVHVASLWVLITRLGIEAMRANVLAFLLAFCVSFSGQCFWTFRAQEKWRSSLVKFLLVSVSAFALNSLLLKSLLSIPQVPPAAAAIAAAFLIPPIT